MGVKKRRKAILQKRAKRKVKKRRAYSKAKKKRVAKIKVEILTKYKKNPIISPRAENDWERWQTFNPGVISLQKKIHFLYRAIGEDGISRLGYAVSDDGFMINERLNYPVYEHQSVKPGFNSYSFYSLASGGSFGGAEDPRIVKVDKEDTLYMTYTACEGGLRVALTSIKVKDFLQRRWRWKAPKLISPPGEVHKNWVIFPEKIRGQYAILHSISPKISISYRDSLEFQEGEYIESYYEGTNRKKDGWEGWFRGAGPPPLKTSVGWLLFYHALAEGEYDKYKVGAMLLDFQEPTKILCRYQKPILEPEEDYENNGFKAGVVYVSGAVVKDGELFIYYGASDSYIAVAHASLKEFTTALTKGMRPQLKTKVFKKKKYDR